MGRDQLAAYAGANGVGATAGTPVADSQSPLSYWGVGVAARHVVGATDLIAISELIAKALKVVKGL